MSRKIKILDNTLREGEQVPGIFFTQEEKMSLFTAITRAGVDLVDIGMPAAGPQEADFCISCAHMESRAVPGATIRSNKAEIDLAADLGLKEVYIMFPFSPIHIQEKFKTSKEQIMEESTVLFAHAEKRGLHINLAAEDASRSTPELLEELCRHFSQNGASRILLCDTVGCATPDSMKTMVETALEASNNRVQIGVHCHNDFGLATANTLAGIKAGADIASVTLNGLGERAGNAPLHEVVTGIEQLLDLQTNVDLLQLKQLSQLAEDISGLFLWPLSPVVGINAFKHESGIHVDGLLKSTRVYEHLTPESVNRHREFAIGKFTGIHYLNHLLKQRDISAEKADLYKLKQAIVKEKISMDKSFIAHLRQDLEKYYDRLTDISEIRFRELVDETLS